jgi:hypothetical protein
VQGRSESWDSRPWIEKFLNAPNVAKWEAPLKTVRYPHASDSWRTWGEPIGVAVDSVVAIGHT